MDNEKLKKYEGKMITVTKKDKATIEGKYQIDWVQKCVIFEKDNIETFPIKGNPKIKHVCPLIIPISTITDIIEM